MDYHDHITAHPEIMMGKPVIKGSRITVEFLLRKLSEGIEIDELIQAYPSLKREDILAALSYSAAVIGREEMIAC